MLLAGLHGDVAISHHIRAVGDAGLDFTFHQIDRDRTRTADHATATQAGRDGTDVCPIAAIRIGGLRGYFHVTGMHLVAIAATGQRGTGTAANLVEGNGGTDADSTCHCRRTGQ